VRTVRLPAVAPERLTEMLALDLERATPFKTSEVMFGWTVSPDQPESGGPMEIQQVVVKRPIVETALAELSDLGIRAQFVDCWRDGLHAFDANVLASELAGEERERRRSRLLPVLTLLVLALAAIGVMQVLQRQERAIAALRAEVAAATERAAMRNRANALTSLAQQRVATILDLKRNRPAAIAVWNEITRVLPDTAYLSDLMLDGDQLVMSGYAQSAAELVPLLKASPLVADVALAAQVVFDEAVGRERFDIRVRIATAEPVAAAEEALP
jgi:general secretion pathway protein L